MYLIFELVSVSQKKTIHIGAAIVECEAPNHEPKKSIDAEQRTTTKMIITIIMEQKKRRTERMNLIRFT